MVTLPARGRAGLTLVELLVVLTIVGVTSAVAVPALARLARGGAADAAAELVTALHLARDAAAARRERVTLTLETASGRYWVVAGAAGAAPLRQGVLSRDPRVRIGGVPAGWLTVSFDPLGRARGGALFITDGDASYEVAVGRWNGAVGTRAR